MNERVTIDVEDHVASVKLSRPEKQNALDMSMFEGLTAAARSLQTRSDVRVVILHGQGDHFSSGIDTSIFGGAGVDPKLLQPIDGTVANFFQAPAYAWRELEVPVICVIKGNTLGGGLQIALGADIRIAAPDARLSIMEVRWGLIPDIAITATLRHIMPIDRVKELTFSGRILSGSEANELGLVTRVSDDPLAEARQLAKGIAASSPDAIRAAKKLINEGWKLSDAESLRLEAELQMRVMAGPNQAEAVRAQMERRAPEFKD